MHREWTKRLNLLRHSGHPIGPRGYATRELIDQKFKLDDSTFNLLDVPERKLNYRFAVAEWIWMMFGRSDVGTIATYNSVMREFSDDGVWLTGAYGPHIHAQKTRVLNKLVRDPATRQAVIEIHRPQIETKDEPCTLSLQFLIRQGRLELIATMRSSDVWLGIPYDVFTFTQIQNCFAGMLNVERGGFSLHMGSSHLYERDEAKARDCIHSRSQSTIETPNLPGLPPPYLEDIMVDKMNGRVCDYERHRNAGPWWPYAQVLMSNTSEEARLILLANQPGRKEGETQVSNR